MAEPPDNSSRLADSQRGAGRRASQRDESTRLIDRASTEFQQRRRQAEQRRDQLREGASEFASALDLTPDGVRPVQLDDRGEEIGFVPNARGRDQLTERFAEPRPFVESDEALVQSDPRDGVRTRTDPDAVPDIAARAAADAAGDSPFISPDDLEAEVGPGGVTGVETRPGRRDDIASRVQQDLAADDPFAEPGDFGVEVSSSGIEEARFTETGERRRAGRQFESETPLGDVDPFEDVRETGDGFELREGPQREIAATEFEQNTPLRDVDPLGDVTQTDSGFGLDQGAQRRVAARRFEAELDQFGTGELDPTSDIQPVNDGFGLGRDPAREVAADRIDEQIDRFDIGPGDIELEETSTGRFEGIFEREVSR